MANSVFANGREVSCKAGSGKSIACFPDVCMTPPENPATPPGVPVPYPNTGMTSDTTDGSRTVKITGKEVMLKNKSYFKKSMGDEAGAAAKKGVVSSVNRGKVYFTSWSMDVKVEGENAVRHLDMTTHNHGSTMNTPPWPFADEIAAGAGKPDPCEKEKKNVEAACAKHGGDRDKECADDECQKAQACKLVPYKKPGTTTVASCCKGYAGDHLIEKSSFFADKVGGTSLAGCSGYDLNKAPVCCVKGRGAYTKDHGKLSHLRGAMNMFCPEKDSLKDANGKGLPSQKATTYGEAKENAARAVRGQFTHCDEACIKAQLDAYDKDCKISDDTEIKAHTYGDSTGWLQELYEV